MGDEQIKTVEGKAVTAHGSGTSVKINDATVTTANVAASNGVVHIIDTVLLPPSAPTQNIVQVAAATPDLSTLVDALGAAALIDTLKSTGPFTVFAPSNEAFAKLPKATLDSLLKPENKAKLVDILTYHVVAGDVNKADLMDMDMLQ